MIDYQKLPDNYADSYPIFRKFADPGGGFTTEGTESTEILWGEGVILFILFIHVDSKLCVLCALCVEKPPSLRRPGPAK